MTVVGRAPQRGLVRSAVATFVVWRLLIAGLLLFAFHAVPRPPPDRATLVYASIEELGNQAPFMSWDGQQYMRLAEEGYPDRVEMRSAFAPLLPGLIWCARHVMPPFWAGLAVTSLAALLAFVAFAAYARRLLPDELPWWALIVSLSFPSAFFLGAIYTEGLFLALLFGFLALHQRSSRWALLLALLLPIARGQGIFLAGPLLALPLWRSLRERRIVDGMLVASGAAVIAGFGLVLVFHHLTTGDYRAGIRGQDMFIFGNRLSNIFDPVHFVSYMTSGRTALFAWTHGVVDRVMVVLMFGLIPIVWRSRAPLLILAYLALAVVPALMGSGGAYTRYALPAFWLASIPLTAQLQHRPRVLLGIGVTFGAVQVILLVRFALNLWVA